jgi:hypothetical protein
MGISRAHQNLNKGLQHLSNFTHSEKALSLGDKKESENNDNKSDHIDQTLPSFPGIFKNAQSGLNLPNLFQPLYVTNNHLNNLQLQGMNGITNQANLMDLMNTPVGQEFREKLRRNSQFVAG